MIPLFLLNAVWGQSTVLLYNCGLLAQQSDRANADAIPIRTTTYTNNLFVNPYFLPMLQQSVLYTATTNNNLLTWGGHIGDTYTARYPQSAGGKATIRLKTTADTSNNDAPNVNNGSVVPIAEDGTLRFQGTERPGIYQVEIQTQGKLQRDFFAVNVDATEADLARIPIQQAAVRVGARTTADAETEEATLETDAYNVKRQGKEIWGELLLLAVCLMLLESFLSNREKALTIGEA